MRTCCKTSPARPFCFKYYAGAGGSNVRNTEINPPYDFKSIDFSGLFVDGKLYFYKRGQRC